MLYTSLKQIYENPKEYDKELTGSDVSDDVAEAAFYTSFIKKGSVLYLGSGSGRLYGRFSQINKDITCIELSKYMIKTFRSKYPKGNVIEANALTLRLGKRFDVVIAPYRFICHFSQEELAILFNVVESHLKAGGIFVGDEFNPYDYSEYPEFNDIKLKGNYLEKSYFTYDIDKQLCTEFIERTDTVSGKYDLFKLDLYYYFPSQFSQLVLKNNMRQKNLYGSFKKTKFKYKSKLQDHLIFVFEKKN